MTGQVYAQKHRQPVADARSPRPLGQPVRRPPSARRPHRKQAGARHAETAALSRRAAGPPGADPRHARRAGSGRPRRCVEQAPACPGHFRRPGSFRLRRSCFRGPTVASVHRPVRGARGPGRQTGSTLLGAASHLTGGRMNLREVIRTIPDHPKPGIMFRDITTLLSDAAAFRYAVDALTEPLKGRGSTRSPASRRAASSWAAPSPTSCRPASCRCARRASCLTTPGRWSTRWSTARTPSRCTWMRCSRASAWCWSTT